VKKYRCPRTCGFTLYDVSGDQMTRVGGVSVTSSAVNVGQILRVAVTDNFAYTAVFPGGIEVVDLQQAITEYNEAVSTNITQFGVQISTDGQGFANDAVVNTIPVVDASGRNVLLMGIQAGDMAVAGSDPQNPTTQRIVVATGSAPGTPLPNPVSFVVADPTLSGSSAMLYSGSLQLNGSSLTAGIAVALGQITDSIPDASGNLVQKQVAVVVGRGTAPDPAHPGQTISGGMLAVAAGFGSQEIPLPSNLLLYDVSGDQMTRVGGVSVTSSAVNVGQILRVAVTGNFAYTAVFPGGIEVVDLQQAITEYNEALSTNITQFEVQISTDGQGFANDAVVNTIPVVSVRANPPFRSCRERDYLDA
jgi:hypothetical protein